MLLEHCLCPCHTYLVMVQRNERAALCERVFRNSLELTPAIQLAIYTPQAIYRQCVTSRQCAIFPTWYMGCLIEQRRFHRALATVSVSGSALGFTFPGWLRSPSTGYRPVVLLMRKCNQHISHRILYLQLSGTRDSHAPHDSKSTHSSLSTMTIRVTVRLRERARLPAQSPSTGPQPPGLSRNQVPDPSILDVAAEVLIALDARVRAG
jgi:hypothetical protein